MEGDLERINHDKKTTKIYIAHLFNDTFIISTNWKGMGYKFHRAVNLGALCDDGYTPAVKVEAVSSVVYTNMFDVVTPSITYSFRCSDETDMKKWISALRSRIEEQAALQIERNREKESDINRDSSKDLQILSQIKSTELGSMCSTLKGVNITDFVPHVKKIVEFLDAGYVESSILSSFRNVVVIPLAASSRGAALTVGALTEERNKDISRNSMMQEKGTYLSAITKASAKSQSQAITAALVDDADALLCIHTIEKIATSMTEFLRNFEDAMSGGNWDPERIKLGDIFLSQRTKILFTSFVTFSSGMLALIRLCNSKILTSFRKEAEEVLRPHRVEAILRSVLFFPYKCQSFLSGVIDIISPDLLKEDKLQDALSYMDDNIAQIEKEIAIKKNFEKLLEIKSGFIGELLPDPVLKNLVTNTRKFIAEDDLQKVCRKKNKPFRFGSSTITWCMAVRW